MLSLIIVTNGNYFALMVFFMAFLSQNNYDDMAVKIMI